MTLPRKRNGRHYAQRPHARPFWRYPPAMPFLSSACLSCDCTWQACIDRRGCCSACDHPEVSESYVSAMATRGRRRLYRASIDAFALGALLTLAFTLSGPGRFVAGLRRAPRGRVELVSTLRGR